MPMLLHPASFFCYWHCYFCAVVPAFTSISSARTCAFMAPLRRGNAPPPQQQPVTYVFVPYLPPIATAYVDAAEINGGIEMVATASVAPDPEAVIDAQPAAAQPVPVALPVKAVEVPTV